MEIRAVLVDMDGTLLEGDQVTVSKRNLAALRTLHARGVEVIPCTGRVADMLPPAILDTPWIRYAVTCHGASVYDRQARRTLYRNALSPEASARVLAALEGRGLYAECAADNTIYIERETERMLTCPPVPPHHAWYMCQNRAYTSAPVLSALFLQNGLELEKVNLYNIPENQQRAVYDAVNRTGLIRHTRGEAGPNLEFSPRTLRKADAVDALFGEMGIAYAQVLAIGDSSTDEEVIRRAAIGVAMGNASEEVLRAADEITAPNTEDGFAQAIERHWR